jgi:hypothetical protein
MSVTGEDINAGLAMCALAAWIGALVNARLGMLLLGVVFCACGYAVTHNLHIIPL